MEEQIKLRVELMGMDYLGVEEASIYRNDPEIEHVEWNLREYEGKTMACFADEIEQFIHATRYSYQMNFEPFAIYQEPIIDEPGGVHLFLRK